MAANFFDGRKPGFLHIYILSLLFISIVEKSNAAYFFQEDQVTYTQYKGEIVNERTKKPLVFANLSIEGTNISTITNSEGEFILKIPDELKNKNLNVTFLGYKSKVIPLAEMQKDNNKIGLEVLVTNLPQINISAPKNARELVFQTLQKKGENYFDNPMVMTAFYRETIKKRRKNVSLSEAVVNIFKTPYTSQKRDAVQLYKARKSTDYSKLDTVALKLQGGPFNTLFVDIMKYPEYIFTADVLDDYKFSFDHSTTVNNRLIYVINFKQYENVYTPLYEGKLFIDVENKILTSAIFALNITNKEEASKLFVRRKPRNATVHPTEIAYRVDYREKDGRWYYGYSNVLMEFKINWDDRLFNSVYSMTAEMAVTDWEQNLSGETPKFKNRLKSSIIMGDEAIGFSDPDFWGEYNIIEPEKSIESAIRKINRQLRRAGNNDPSGTASNP